MDKSEETYTGIYHISDLMMGDLVNYGFKSFNNHNCKLPINVSKNKTFLDIVREGGRPIIRFSSNNSHNTIQFYVISVNSQEPLIFGNLILKTNYYIFDNAKYKFD
jgi:hypothetical protein